MASVLSSDGKQDPDVMAVNATSAALMLSDIPWGGPVGVIRIGRISGKFIINPTMDEVRLKLRLELSLMDSCMFCFMEVSLTLLSCDPFRSQY